MIDRWRKRRQTPAAWLWALAMGFLCLGPVSAEFEEEVVSFRCALAIDSVLAELDENAENLVIQQALSHINDNNGQLVCITISPSEIQVRLQYTEMANNENRLVLSLDANTYAVNKIFYGR